MIKTAILTGVTSSGKTSIALDFAKKNKNIEIINADSLLIYKNLDIGTAKPSAEDLKSVKHHMVDIRNPDETFTAGDFVRETQKALNDIHARNKRALIVGGTGFYLKALLFGLWEAPQTNTDLRKKLDELDSMTLFKELENFDPESAYRITPNDRYRLIRALETITLSGKTPSQLESEAQKREVRSDLFLMITDREDDDLLKRIQTRTQQMIVDGIIEETKSLMTHYPESRTLLSVGYRETSDFIKGIAPQGRKMRPGINGLTDEINLGTKQLVKRQRTWFQGQFINRNVGKIYTLEQDYDQLVLDLESIYL